MATLALAVSLLCSAPAGAAGFIEDSHAELVLRNYYFDRNYLGQTTQAAAREWAQGFILNVSSGFSQGPLGFGLDAKGMLGVKLDSSPDRAGTGLLPIAFASPTRLLPQTFRGAYLRSSDIDRLSLHAGWLDRINLRDSTDYQKMSIGSPNGRR